MTLPSVGRRGARPARDDPRGPDPRGSLSVSALSGSSGLAVLLDVQTADGLVDGFQDERPVLGEEV